MRRHALLSRGQRQLALAHNIRVSHQTLHVHIAGHSRLSSMLIPHVGWETARVSPTHWAEENVGETLAVSQSTDETVPSVGTDVSSPVSIPTTLEDEIQVGTDVSGPENTLIAVEDETFDVGNKETAGNRETARVSPTPYPSQRVGETLAVSQLHHTNVPTSNDDEATPLVGTDVSSPVSIPTTLEDEIQVGTDVSGPANITVVDEDVMHQFLQEPVEQQTPHEKQQEHHEQPEQPPTPKTRQQPKRGRIVERPTTTDNTLTAPPTSKVAPPAALSKNANMYRASDNNTLSAQSAEADDLFAPRATDDRSPQAWAARLFKTAQPEQTRNEPSPSVPSVTDAMMRLNEVGTDVSSPVGISTVNEEEIAPLVGTDSSRSSLGSIADRESKSPTDRELNSPTDAHEGLPYYTERASRVHPPYSRVAPRGRPLEVPGRSLEVPGRTRFVAPLPQTTQPIQLSQHARAFLRPLVGIDPTDVSIYQDTAAEHVTDKLNADAVTLSAETIALAPEHLPDTPATLGLLAHELTHVARRRSPRFVPPVVSENNSSSSTVNTIPIAYSESSMSSTDEETMAESVEQLVIEAAQGQHGSTKIAPEPLPNGATEILKNAQASSAENIFWGDLPAPWEPLPDWLAVPVAHTPIAARSTGTQVAAQASLYQGSEGVHSGNSDLVHTSQSLNSDTMVEDIQRAGRERTLEQEDVLTASASSTQTPAQEPQPDLDTLARQVYSVLKRRLEMEYRRSQ